MLTVLCNMTVGGRMMKFALLCFGSQQHYQKEIEEMELLKTTGEAMPITTVIPNAFQSFVAFFKARIWGHSQGVAFSSLLEVWVR